MYMDRRRKELHEFGVPAVVGVVVAVGKIPGLPVRVTDRKTVFYCHTCTVKNCEQKFKNIYKIRKYRTICVHGFG